MNRFEASWLAAARADGIRGQRVLVACSGGGDSVALLAFLWAVRRSLGLELVVAHAQHGLRPEAGQEADLVRRLCRSADLDLVEARLEVRAHAQASGLGVETAARELRWAWLSSLAGAERAAVVATGHTLDDHTETVLVRLARGGGAGCLTPLPRVQGLRWSPLIQVRRAELRAYLRQKRIPWMEDASNLEPFTPRNRWRQLLEPMRAEAPALDQHLWETHLQVAELAAFRNRMVASWRGTRWELLLEPRPALLLGHSWTEPELRWSLEAAARACGWPREPDLLRGLAAWILPHVSHKPRKGKSWGGWSLERAPEKTAGPAHGAQPGQGLLLPWVLLREADP
ncbi:MAG: tRNA lysidine(34) synthetase TilS [Holophaga sp.]|nr:tRNA lysidine(34) synthetase TilS [Holophaga sp.]